LLESVNSQTVSQSAPGAGQEYNQAGVTTFVTPFMISGTSKLNGQVSGNKQSAGGASFGASVAMNDDKTNVGLAVTIANSNTKFKDKSQGSKLKGQTRAFTLFANHIFENELTLQGSLSFGSTDYKINQQIRVDSKDIDNSGKYSAKFTSLSTKVGYGINTGSSVKVMPYVGLRYDSIKDDAYKMTLADTTPKSNGRLIGSKSYNKYVISLGTRLSGSIDYDEVHLVPFADLGFGYNLGKKTSAKSVELGNYVVTAEYASKDNASVRGNLGFDANMKNGLSVTLMGGMDMLGSKTTVYNGSLKLGYKF